MKLNPGTKLLKLFEQYPFLIDFLAEFNPHYKKLKNPVLRNTLGRIATLQMASAMGDIPVEQLMKSLAEEIEKNSGEKVEVESETNLDLDPAKLESLKGIIRDLHDGGDFNEIKSRFSDLVTDVDPTEIAEMEQQLIKEGLPAEEVKKLCDVHVEMFKESLDGQAKPEMLPGHPVHTFMAENREIEKLTGEIRGVLGIMGAVPDPVREIEAWGDLVVKIEKLSEIEKHYLRKENQLFPQLEKVGFTGPTQVMWAIHDDVRALFKEIRVALDNGKGSEVAKLVPDLLKTIEEMIYKEESILFVVSLDLLQHEDWANIRKGEDELGYTFFTPGSEWNPRIKFNLPPKDDSSSEAGNLAKIPLDTGLVSLEHVNLIFKHLPVEISFVDENDEVRYYSEVPHKIFPRSPGVIGRKVQNCHPPKSLHMVTAILHAFRSGTKDVADFWMEMNGKFIYIRYFAVRDHDGRYKGTLEVVQDVTEIRKLEGSKRLLEWSGAAPTE